MPSKPSLEARRTFLARALSMLGVGMCSGTLATVLTGCETDVLKSSNIAVQFDVGAEPALAQVGGAVKQIFNDHNGGAPGFIIRQDQKEFLVLSTVCTHQACEVNLPGQGDLNLLCECHESLFNAQSGAVIRGPAQAPLARFESAFEDDLQVLTITF